MINPPAYRYLHSLPLSNRLGTETRICAAPVGPARETGETHDETR